MSADYSPGFYKINFRAISIGELLRAHGPGKLFLCLKRYWLKQRQKGYWLPWLIADSECSPRELPPRFWEATLFFREPLQRLGFTEFALTRITPQRNLSPALREHCVIHYLHPNRSHIASIRFLQMRVPGATSPHPGKVTAQFRAAFANRLVSYTNGEPALVDASPGNEIFHVRNAAPQFLYQHFTNHLDRLTEKPITFPDNESLRRYLDERQIAAFRLRVDRGLFVRMTDAEIEKFRRNMPAST